MALFPKFPYLNFHELNLNWLIDQVKTNKDSIEKIDSITADFIISKTADGQGFQVNGTYNDIYGAFKNGNQANHIMAYAGATTTIMSYIPTETGNPMKFTFIEGIAYDSYQDKWFMSCIRFSIKSNNEIVKDNVIFELTTATFPEEG